MTTVIDGKAVAADLREKVAQAVAKIKEEHNVQPALAVVLVGEDPASQVYVRNKHTATEKSGMRSIEHKLPETTREEDVVALVRNLNEDPEVDGILVQLPLPKHISSDRVLNEIHPDKDVDGLTEVNAGRLMLGKDGLVPCTPQGSVILAKTVKENLSGLKAVVVGRSILVGKPLAMLLLAENCTVTMAHSRTKDLAAVCREADILCAAVGIPRLIKGDWVKKGAIVIDVGINRIEEDGKKRLVGDVDYGAAKDAAAAITPVPGGVGPMTIACLLRNTVLAAARRRGLGAVEV
ncbi:bifunctional methylenetetrahydrofolate dehydrogenase/methenyltetrahydrofolate cyclohydrolase FolD [Hyphococcus luteus]|uniref:Bifunctional protein FolD n=1 Tax=Hyphococcus luteus TaxID=2058213 RepID=A0A2S7K1Y5_9PROT|nr:bifunctional methylenetetrahydrofolate dehydrogenase/methenyltetrahydrofolate cyclohydrolase FolD [Marinicaulis flavus]PQA86525.1 bifunctional methylenetetrahydrofolate dehydrogenase/methenyltetrahydrofolate cyclohydrolase FolD [Marinicaulis flavus]